MSTLQGIKQLLKKPLPYYLSTTIVSMGFLLGGCANDDSSSPTPTPTPTPTPAVAITTDPATLSTTMIGNTVGVATATISEVGTSTVTASVDTPAYVATISDPNPCALDVSGTTSCDFTIDSLWDPANLDNSANDAIVTETNSVSFAATNSADVTGSPVSAEVITPYVYLPVVANNGAAENDGGTGIQYGAGTNIDPRFEAGSHSSGAPCPPGADVMIDNLTGLMWSKSANIGWTVVGDAVTGIDSLDGSSGTTALRFCTGTGYVTSAGYPQDCIDAGNQPQAQQAITAINAYNDIGLCGYTDWRLPTVNELKSLVNYGDVAGPDNYLNTAFDNVQADSYWSSNVDAAHPSLGAWYVDMDDGGVYLNVQDAFYYVWPVRGGQ